MLETVAIDLDHPECVIWVPEGYLLAGGEAGQLWRVDPQTGVVTQLGTSNGWLLGLAIDAERNVYACDPKNQAVLKFDQHGAHQLYSRGTANRPMVTPNFPAFDQAGNLYVSDSGTWGDDDGCIFKISPTGETSIWSESTKAFPNGLALSADGRYLYVVQSTLPGISRIEIEPDGTAGAAQLVVAMPMTVPDGVAFDETGRLYIGCYRPDRIYTFDDAEGLQIIADDFQGTALSAPTNVAFGGTELRTLYIASLGRWHIARLPTESRGLTLNLPSLEGRSQRAGG